jgi:UDP-N-acetylmuramyl tripeptide synthase
VLADGRRVPVSITLPGRFNTANAVMAAVAAEAFGLEAEASLAAMAGVGGVAGRFTVQRVGGVPTRLLLAKNPAGWAELLRLVRQGQDPVVVAINARVADGRDPSWLWDVPFEQLVGRLVVASGERSRDLSVRLRYAGVAHVTVADPVAAIAAAAWAMADQRPGGAEGGWSGAVELIGNYTAFHDVLGRADVGHHRPAGTADNASTPSTQAGP